MSRDEKMTAAKHPATNPLLVVLPNIPDAPL